MKYSYGENKHSRRQWPTALSPSMPSMNAARDWCKAQDSEGKFYFHYTNTRWWFEREEDAIHFTLMWAGR